MYMSLRLFWWICCHLCCTVYAYQSETIHLESAVSQLRTSDTCALVRYNQTTQLYFYASQQTITTHTTANVVVINEDCSMVLFGHPENNTVTVWKPLQQNITLVQKNSSVSRFGYALAIQNETWIVGAPGHPADNQGQGTSMGHAYVFEGTQQLIELVADNVDTNQQFGFDVALSSSIHQTPANFFVSAPGDTHRFMEDNRGENIGRVFQWSLGPNTDWHTVATFDAPILAGSTYRAFGRAIAASPHVLVVTSYPLYDEPNEPFVFMYECTAAECQPDIQRGISINNLPGNVLGYLTAEELSYTDGKQGAYIPADVEGDDLGDFQNAFIGQTVGIVGSNVILPDTHHDKLYRITIDNVYTHAYEGHFGLGDDTQHLVFGSINLTHIWNCPLGYVGPENVCTPCPTSYFSDDGWSIRCHVCPVNYTTNKTGQSACSPWTIPVGPAFELQDVINVIMITVGVTLLLVCFVVACECCSPKGRQKRGFDDTRQ